MVEVSTPDTASLVQQISDLRGVITRQAGELDTLRAELLEWATVLAGGTGSIPAVDIAWKLRQLAATEDPAPHVHTDDCMCEMYDLEVVGARECTHCGGHTGGPCGSLCEVAYDEIMAQAREVSGVPTPGGTR